LSKDIITLNKQIRLRPNITPYQAVDRPSAYGNCFTTDYYFIAAAIGHTITSKRSWFAGPGKKEGNNHEPDTAPAWMNH